MRLSALCITMACPVPVQFRADREQGLPASVLIIDVTSFEASARAGVTAQGRIGLRLSLFECLFRAHLTRQRRLHGVIQRPAYAPTLVSRQLRSAVLKLVACHRRRRKLLNIVAQCFSFVSCRAYPHIASLDGPGSRTLRGGHPAYEGQIGRASCRERGWRA